MTIRIRWVAVPVVALLAAGCTQESPKPNGTTAPTATTTAPATSATTTAPRASAEGTRPQMKPGMHHFGPVGMFLAAAREQQLKDDQKAALDKIEADQTPDQTMGKDWKDFHEALTAQVKAGKVEPSKLSPQLDTIEKAIDARRDKDADALNKVHATLDPAQRKAVVADIRAKQAAREAERAKVEQGKEKEKDADRIQHTLDRMKKELGLDDAQQKSIQAILEKSDKGPASWEAMRDEMKKRMDAMLTAFEGDSFDAKKLDWQPMAPKKVREHMEKRAQVLAQIVPVLKPDQRDKLAAQMEKMPMMTPPMGHAMGGMHGPMGGPGMRGPMGVHPMMGSPFPFDEPPPLP